MALYDYIPSSSVAGEKSGHLSFNAGDIIVTYGSRRPDGLYQAKVTQRFEQYLYGETNVNDKALANIEYKDLLKNIYIGRVVKMIIYVVEV